MENNQSKPKMTTNVEEAKIPKDTDAMSRGSWDSKIEFILACIGYSVGLGNVWRFPYLVFKNGGGKRISYTILDYAAGCRNAIVFSGAFLWSVCKSWTNNHLASDPFVKSHNVLKQSSGIDVPGNFQWKLTVNLILAWFVVFVVLVRGIKSLGKVVYFTALFPYFVLLALLIRGATLEGSLDGVKYYLTPKWHKLAESSVWSDAATQVFYSLSISCGGLITMSSYNKFNNNCLRDSILVPLIDCFTSFFSGFVIFTVLGFMAKVKGVDVETVVKGGPGLAFIAYPEAITKMPSPTVWAILFFLMMITIGFSSQVVIISKAIQYKVVTLHSYVYPRWAQTIGWLIVIIPLVIIPVYFVVKHCQSGGYLVMVKSLKPLSNWGPSEPENRTGKYAEEADDDDSGSRGGQETTAENVDEVQRREMFTEVDGVENEAFEGDTRQNVTDLPNSIATTNSKF
ncbi:sodiumchloride1-likedependent and chloride-dependent glycine transporter 1-like [Octopus vulgaris]|uniref:Sodiumchloride1-likedependent and chloride-dependent glycine transporter 1-like n=1 Tax=Octopus vulgaris TaxID=6645 RepID=A0AA36FHM5_OCTVU|nr:sodiumchloride1-likedependent and chloride-dependent glycine transporter 1-like [Octopus vulgaris]